MSAGGASATVAGLGAATQADAGAADTTIGTTAGAGPVGLRAATADNDPDDGRATFTIDTSTDGQAPASPTSVPGLVVLDTEETYEVTGDSEEDDAAELALGSESNVQITGAAIDPSEIDEGRTVTQTLTLDVANVSDDGSTDTISVNFPSAVQNVELNSASIEDADGDTVAITRAYDFGTLVTADVNPDSSAEARDLTATVSVDVTVSDVSTDPTAEIATSVSDSAHGTDAAGLGVTIRETTAAATTELSLSPGEQTVTPGNTATYDIVIGETSDGVGSFNLNVGAAYPSTATIVDASNTINGVGQIDIADDGSSVQVGAFDGGEDIPNSGTDVRIATVTVQGENAGSTALGLSVTSVSDEHGGEQYTFTGVNDASVTVAATDRTELSLSPSEQTLAPGDTTTYDIVVGETSDGVGSFNLNVEAANPSTATIIDASNRINGVGQIDIADDGSSVQVGAFAGDVPHNETDVRIATVTVQGENAGSTALELSPSSVGQEDGGEQYTITGVNDASVTVAADPVTIRLVPTEATVGTGGTTTLEIVAEETDAGVGGYDLEVDVSDASRAEIVGASQQIGGNGEEILAPDGSEVAFAAFAGDIFDTGPVTIATVTVEGVETGAVDVSVTANSVSTVEQGLSYDIGSTTGASLEVVEELVGPDVTGDGNPATDPDGDGLYEDVNGDGTTTPGDATVLFRAAFTGNAAVTENVALFDFNGDEAITPGDATGLFNEVF